MNKYVTSRSLYYPRFLKHLQDELLHTNYEIHFIFYSDLLKKSVLTNHNYFYDAKEYHYLSKDDIENQARRIETEYEFTFKQAWFPDILQTSRFQNGRKISVPEVELNNTSHLIGKFLFLEKLVLDEKIDVLFSDVSPEVEMEFGRAIGLKHGIPVLKTYEGSFLGKTVLLQHYRFGKDRLVESVTNPDYSDQDAEGFIFDFVANRKPAYERVQKLEIPRTIIDKIKDKIAENNAADIVVKYPLQLLKRLVRHIYLSVEQQIVKPMIYDQFDPDIPYLFYGFHLNQESTMGLRSLPYVNQTVLAEMVSRVLPYGYILYVREHPHWPKTYPVRYLSRLRKYPNVRLLSPKISIHDILKNSKGVVIYNSNTGIEALLHGKPVLSFSSNIYYKHHSAVLQCTDLFELGSKLVRLVNTDVDKQETRNYIRKLMSVSIDMLFGADCFVSEEDACEKAIKISRHLSLAIEWLKIKN